MKLRELLVITDIVQSYEIWCDGQVVVQETSDLQRFSESNGAPEDLVELNLESEIKKVYTRPFNWNKNRKNRACIIIDMLEWRNK